MISSADIPFNLQIWLMASILPYLSILIWKRVSPGWITYDSWAFPAASLFSFCTASWHVSVLYVHLLPAGRFVRFYLLFLSLHPEAVLFCPIFVLYLSALLIFFLWSIVFLFRIFFFTGALIILFIILFIILLFFPASFCIVSVRYCLCCLTASLFEVPTTGDGVISSTITEETVALSFSFCFTFW